MTTLASSRATSQRITSPSRLARGARGAGSTLMTESVALEAARARGRRARRGAHDAQVDHGREPIRDRRPRARSRCRPAPELRALQRQSWPCNDAFASVRPTPLLPFRTHVLPHPDIRGRPAPLARGASGAPSTWSSPSPRSMTSCRPRATPTPRGGIRTAVPLRAPSRPAGPAGCPRDRILPTPSAPAASPAPASADTSAAPVRAQLGGRGRPVDMEPTASGPPPGGPRRVRRRSAFGPAALQQLVTRLSRGRGRDVCKALADRTRRTIRWRRPSLGQTLVEPCARRPPTASRLSRQAGPARRSRARARREPGAPVSSSRAARSRRRRARRCQDGRTDP